MIPLALGRVTVLEDTGQDAAAVITVDYSGRRDHATVSINPETCPPEAVEGYRLRGAIMAALERLRRYNRTVTRRVGTSDAHQKQFEEAMTDAAREIEELIHAYPYPARAVAAAHKAAATVSRAAQLAAGTMHERVFPPGFPCAYALARLGEVVSIEHLSETPDEALSRFLTPEQIAKVRAAAAFLDDLEPATPGELPGTSQDGAGGPPPTAPDTQPMPGGEAPTGPGVGAANATPESAEVRADVSPVASPDEPARTATGVNAPRRRR